jgi:hypothetical protein
VREVRRPDDQNGQLLHVPRLRHEHRLQLARFSAIFLPELPGARVARGRCVMLREGDPDGC